MAHEQGTQVGGGWRFVVGEGFRVSHMSAGSCFVPTQLARALGRVDVSVGDGDGDGQIDGE